MSQLHPEIAKRRTFAIISHPDAGKTTLTEKLLLFGNAIQLAGSVKAKRAERHATSDWMELEKQRGISVTTSVMQFPYADAIVNLLDTPGHADFSEDTYRTLTAVDSALMVIDAAKGVEDRTIKLLEVCRLRNTPIMTFVNKLDRDAREPIEILDEIEQVLNIQCAPITWPVGSGKNFKGIYHLLEDFVVLYETGRGERIYNFKVIQGLNNPELDQALADHANELREEIELVKGASHAYDKSAYLQGKQTPVFFGTALGNFGIKEMLDVFVVDAPAPQIRETLSGNVTPDNPNFSGFVFKIQANMDPAHHDRIAFLRICSGQYQKGIRTFNSRLQKEVSINNAHTFLAGSREHADSAWAGDIIGVHNHGTIQIGDTFCSKKDAFQFTGIPYFAPELFKRIRLRDPLKMKALQKGLDQLSEEGATQVFRPLLNNDLILGAIGILQFDVVVYRLKTEYKVECSYEPINVSTARWIQCDNAKKLAEFKDRAQENLALDAGGHLTYIAPSIVNLQLTEERWPDIRFNKTREHGHEL